MTCESCKYCLNELCYGCGEFRLVDPEGEPCENYEPRIVTHIEEGGS